MIRGKDRRRLVVDKRKENTYFKGNASKSKNKSNPDVGLSTCPVERLHPKMEFSEMIMGCANF
jgi:hypothetical protein